LPALLGAGLIAPALAQNTNHTYRPTGTRIVQEPEPADPDLARRLVKLTGSCVNRRFPDGAVALLRGGNADAFAYAAQGIRNEDNESPLGLSECLHEALNGAQLSTEMRIPERNLRIALAEDAYLRRHPQPLVIAPGSPGTLAGRAVIGGSSPEQARAMGLFADCLVFTAPAEADSLLRGPVGGDEERANARALAPAIGACLANGQQVNFTPTTIREYVADGLWARSEAMAAAGTAQ